MPTTCVYIVYVSLLTKFISSLCEPLSCVCMLTNSTSVHLLSPHMLHSLPQQSLCKLARGTAGSQSPGKVRTMAQSTTVRTDAAGPLPPVAGAAVAALAVAVAAAAAPSSRNDRQKRHAL